MAASKGLGPPRPVDEQKASLAKALPGPARLAKQHERLQLIQDELLERSLSVVDSSVRFAEIEEDQQEVPQAWVDELGPVGAQIRFRVAKAGWKNAKEAPVGIKVAASIAAGIMKANALKDSAPKVLNIAIIEMPAPQFPEQEIEVGR